MQTLEIVHTTVYRYARPVAFGEHQAMFRPRDSHDLRLLETGLSITPPAQVRWMHDVFSNSLAIASFSEMASELRFESRIKLEHYGVDNPDYPVADFAATYPFAYPSDQVPDLGRTIERHYDDADHKVLDWARAFVEELGPSCDTRELLRTMNAAVKDTFEYAERVEHGCQTPVETLEKGSGSCRDFALFMMEAVRSLGFAARFVSGYLYSPANDPTAEGFQGAGATHAWVQVYLPGAGWIEFDPTNALVGGTNLIRVGVARDPTQAAPLKGSYVGDVSDYLGMSVTVTVRTLGS